MKETDPLLPSEDLFSNLETPTTFGIYVHRNFISRISDLDYSFICSDLKLIMENNLLKIEITILFGVNYLQAIL